jgi:hypothetical protein
MMHRRIEKRKQTNLKDESMLDVEQDLPAISVVSDEDVEGVGILNPSDEARVWRERRDGVALNVKMALERLGVRREKGINETEELHNSLVLTKILVTWQGKGER